MLHDLVGVSRYIRKVRLKGNKEKKEDPLKEVLSQSDRLRVPEKG